MSKIFGKEMSELLEKEKELKKLLGKEAEEQEEQTVNKDQQDSDAGFEQELRYESERVVIRFKSLQKEQ